MRTQEFFTRKLVNFVLEKKAKNSREKFVLGNIHAIRDWGWSPEYVEAIFKMLSSEVSDDYVIATGTETSVLDLVNSAFAYFGFDGEKAYKVSSDYIRPNEIFRSVGDNTKIATKLAWTPNTAGKEVIIKMLKYFNQN